MLVKCSINVVTVTKDNEVCLLETINDDDDGRSASSLVFVLLWTHNELIRCYIS